MRTREEVLQIVKRCIMRIHIPHNTTSRDFAKLTEETVFEYDLWFNNDEMYLLTIACEEELGRSFPWFFFDYQKTIGKLADDLFEYLSIV